ncbi:MAG TPA: 4'-phosphopantetheinyl transferase superfamily protein [Rhodothermales bacterium]
MEIGFAERDTGSRATVHVWRAEIGALSAVVDAHLHVLDAEERARADRFFFERDRRCFVTARTLLRTLLGRYLNVSPAEVRFRYGEQGKPELALDGRDLHFNLSHAGDRVLIAVGRGRQVGVDVEHIRDVRYARSVANRFFSAYERDALQRLSDDEKRAAFFAIWTRKEAFIKALGGGLSHPLDAFDVTVSPDEPARLVATRSDPDATSKWRMVGVDAGPEYAAALVAEGHDWSLKCLNVHPAVFSSSSPLDLTHA